MIRIAKLFDKDRQAVFRGGLTFNPFGAGVVSLRMDIFFEDDFVEKMNRNFPPECAHDYVTRREAVRLVLEREELKALPDELFEPFGLSSTFFFNDDLWFWACVAGNCIIAGPLVICVKKSCGFSWPQIPK